MMTRYTSRNMRRYEEQGPVTAAQAVQYVLDSTRAEGKLEQCEDQIRMLAKMLGALMESKCSPREVVDILNEGEFGLDWEQSE